MVNGLISAIIPIYNAGKTLPKCLDSLLAQEEVELEVLLVNDGSTDESAAICRDYAVRNENVTVVCQDNKGVSVARNNGLRHASGQFIYFMDSDDYLRVPTMLKEMVAQLDNPCISVCCCGLTKEGRSGNTLLSITDSARVVERFDFLHDMLLTPLGGYLSNKLYRADVLVGAEFDEELSFAEDLVFNCTIWRRIDQVAYIPGCLYAYVVNDSSLTHASDCYIVNGAWQFDGLIPRLRAALPQGERIERLLKAREGQQAINEIVLLSGKKDHSSLRARLVDTCRQNKEAYNEFEPSWVKRLLYSAVLAVPECLVARGRVLLGSA